MENKGILQKKKNGLQTDLYNFSLYVSLFNLCSIGEGTYFLETQQGMRGNLSKVREMSLRQRSLKHMTTQNLPFQTQWNHQDNKGKSP